MKFKGGYLGACIIVLSLLMGTAGTILLNVDKVQEYTTTYEYVTDISGLFDYSDAPQYIDFNPASNYTGYTNLNVDPLSPSGIKYTSTTTANNYRVISEAGVTSAGNSGTVDNNTSLAQASLDYTPRSVVYSNEGVNSVFIAGYITGFKVASLYTFVTSIYPTLSDYSEITFNFTYPTIHAPSERAVTCSYAYTVSYEGVNYTSLGGSHWDSIIVNPENKTYQYVSGGNTSPSYSLYDGYIAYGDGTQTESYFSGGSLHTATYSTSLSFSYTSTVTTANQYEYIIPSQGVSTLTNLTTTVWDNDVGSTNYDNYRIDILIGYPFVNGVYDKSAGANGSVNIKIPQGADPSLYEYITISESGDKFRYSAGRGGTTYASGVIGQFDAVIVSIYRNASNDVKADIIGVTSFTNYTDATASPIITKTITYQSTADLDKLWFNADKLYWSVYNTNLFMDTYGSVMVDPSIDLADYWADMNSYRYSFQSFAIYGDSITMNGVNYPVIDESITIDDKTYKLDNFYLSFSEQGDASVTFKNINRTVSLGATTDKTVSFTGTWYFNAGLYEGKLTDNYSYEWDISDPLNNFNINTLILISLGLMVVLALCFIAMRVNFGTLDKAVMIFAGVILLIVLGGS